MFIQLGIVSYGYGCATDYPGVYTRLASYTHWVQTAMDSYSDAAQPTVAACLVFSWTLFITFSL